ncbi:MAG: DUF547 domain-containing protein [Planctomycetota bacterium]
MVVPPDRRLAAYSVEPYAEVLAAAVERESGLVDYAVLPGRLEGRLDMYLDALARFGPETTPERFAGTDARLAYYLNAYNAAMLRLWLDEGAGDGDPDRDVAWLTWFSTRRFVVDGRARSLDDLEHGIVRGRFDDPRIHFALVCGAVSCPPLLAEPFDPARLDAQLDGLGRRWLMQDDGLVVDDDGRVRASFLFAWYAGDFDDWGGLAGVIERYVDEGDPRKARALEAARSGRVSSLPYDWSINQKRPAR